MTGPLRIRLPDRRPSLTVAVEHGGQALDVTVGFGADGRPLEAFCGGPRLGSDLAHLLADGCVIVSLALQHGCPPEALARSLGRVPDPAAAGAERPASALGAVVAVLCREALRQREADDGA